MDASKQTKMIVTFKVPQPGDALAALLARSLKRRFDVKQNSAVPKADYKDSELSYIPIQVAPEARPLKCWFNVRDAVAAYGGKAVFGWSVWIRHDGHYTAVHHAVWQKPDGELVDVTPSETDTTAVLFMADSRVPFDYELLRAPAAYVMHNTSTPAAVQTLWVAPDDTAFAEYRLLRMIGEE